MEKKFRKQPKKIYFEELKERECLLTRLPHLKCIMGWVPYVQVTSHFKCIKLVTCVQVFLYH